MYIINSPHYYCTFTFNVKYDILYIYICLFLIFLGELCMYVLYFVYLMSPHLQNC
jgi:hypothetical protein